ncbi:MAG: hypothetical protein JRI52_07510 [Deltaproteobacteria bacterium]|nr:hypothetical protein [Deltaproteobacteria bacterium]
MPKEIIEALKETDTIKVLTTTDEGGIPHTVFKGSLMALDNETLAYMELLETCRTQRNMLRNHWDNKLVAVGILNEKKGISYQIKGEPVRFIYNGPIWDQFLEQTWKMIPQSDPAGVWLIRVKEVINQDYFMRRKEEEKRVINQDIWRRFIGVRS